MHFNHLNIKVMIVRVILNGITLAVTVLLLPGVKAVDPSVLSFLLLGVIFGLLNALIKPILQVITLPYLFASYGLVVIIINSIVLIVLALLAPELIVIETILGVLVAGVIVGVLGGVLESIFGVTPPILDLENTTESE
jgi:putative membrane protein